MKRKILTNLRSIARKSMADLKISTKIMLFYSVLLVVSIIFSTAIYQRIYSNIISSKVSELSIQTLSSINLNLCQTMENVNNYSKAILSNDDVQDLLRNSKEYVDIDRQNRVNKYLIKLIDAIPMISSTYIFDNNDYKYAVQKSTPKIYKLKSIKEASWYKEVIKNDGAYIIKLNAGGIFDETNEGNFISLIRAVNNTESQKQIGILIVNISERTFVNNFKGIINKYGSDIFLLDEDDKNIVTNRNSVNYNLDKFINESSDKEYNSIIEKIGGKEYLISCLKIIKFNWKIVSIIPFDELSKENNKLSMVALIVILLNSIMLYMGSLFISRLITIPIKKLLRSMKGIEKGEFKKVDIETGNDEIGKLKDGYNIMVSEIEKLINKVVEEQKIKRKAELLALQAQVKPHFLYNTFDAISYLALSGKCEEVYNVMVALGSYYRTSLSKGSEIITIGEELEIVKNYLIIQKVRYGELFSVTYDIDNRIVKYKTLKLVLQPLVENAIYHGIKPKGERGIIKISAKLEADVVRFIIEDDGVGMSDEELNAVLGSKLESNNASFGLRGTIERLRIFYGIFDIYSIESRKGYGTKVTINIPIEGMTH